MQGKTDDDKAEVEEGRGWREHCESMSTSCSQGLEKKGIPG